MQHTERISSWISVIDRLVGHEEDILASAFTCKEVKQHFVPWHFFPIVHQFDVVLEKILNIVCLFLFDYLDHAFFILLAEGLHDHLLENLWIVIFRNFVEFHISGIGFNLTIRSTLKRQSLYCHLP
jgi:hypothetical protein